MDTSKHLEVIKKGERTILRVPHEGKSIDFVYAPTPNRKYSKAGEIIQGEGLVLPTYGQIVSLVYAAKQTLKDIFDSSMYSWEKMRQNPNFEPSKEVVDIIERPARFSHLWGFNSILHVPKEGSYIRDNYRIPSGKISMEKSNLVQRLEAKDPAVRFVPQGYKTNKLSTKDTAENPFIIGLAGEEGAEKIAKIGERYEDGGTLILGVDETCNRKRTCVSSFGAYFHSTMHDSQPAGLIISADPSSAFYLSTTAIGLGILSEN